METEMEKSSEEAKEALEAEEKTSEAKKTEPMVPLHDVTALRTRAQNAEMGQARAEGKLAAFEQQQTTNAPASISPVDAELARQTAEGIDPEDQSISPAIMQADKVYEKQVANQAAEAAATEARNVILAASAKQAKILHPDYQAVIDGGEVLLTDGQILDLTNSGDKFGEKYYATCKKAIELATPAQKPSEQTKEEKVVAEDAAKAKADAEALAAAKKDVPTRDELLKGASPAAATAFNL